VVNEGKASDMWRKIGRNSRKVVEKVSENGGNEPDNCQRNAGKLPEIGEKCRKSAGKSGR